MGAWASTWSKARGWLARALHAPQDPQWTGNGYRSARWSPINPVTGEFDALEWTAPAGVLAQQEAPAAAGKAEESIAPAGAEEAPEAAVDTVRALREAGKASEVLAFQPPLPDDPGPDDEGENRREGERKWSGGYWRARQRSFCWRWR